YRRMAHVYDRLIEPMQAGVRRIALDLVPPDPAWEVLDVGCGTGTGLAGYADAGCDVVGVDVSAAMLERATERLGDRAELHLVSPGPMPFEGDRFDLAITSMVIHEAPEEGRVPLVREMARVVKPGGRLLVIDFRFGSLRGWRGRALRVILPIIERFTGHYRQYRSFQTAGGVPPLLAAAGLEIEREKIVAGGNLVIFVITRAPG
ncbi:MAG: class I SAM-dependent methyltransferase, partial [Acidimicrobiia bacterium]|nr:class I SAM-dependent methyltransferase [Acidimicrobiia bacterium]